LEFFGIYNINKGTDEKEDKINHPGRKNFFSKYNYSPSILGLISCIIGLIVAFPVGVRFFILTLVPLISVVLYGMKVIPEGSRLGFRRLKEVTVLKNIIVSAGWSIPIAFLPLAFFHMPLSLTSMAFFPILFFMVFVNTVVFDMSDVAGDRKHKVMTIPVRIGVTRTKYILTVIYIIIALLIVFSVYSGYLISLAYLLLFNVFYAFIYLYLFGKIDSYVVCDIMVDGEYLLMALVIFLGTYIVA
jgi:4-hydroxybenzoate polyprenyltransferase